MNLSLGINLIGGVTLNTPDIALTTTSKTIPTADKVSSCLDINPGACSASGIVAGGSAVFSTGTINTTVGPDSFSISAGSLQFNFTQAVMATIVPSSKVSAGSISLKFDGTVSGPPAFNGQNVILSETCTQDGIGAAITCSESILTSGDPLPPPPPPAMIPTLGPVALVLLGMAIVGIVWKQQ